MLKAANTEKFSAPSTLLYGMGVSAMAIVNLRMGTFDPMQPIPDAFPGRIAVVYAASALVLFAAVATMWRRFSAWPAAALAAYYTVIVALLMNGRVIAAHYTQYGAYFGASEGLALAAAALIIFAASAKIDLVTSGRFRRTGQCVFGICALFFGGAHFAYPGNTIPLVPKWLPPSQVFWAYATGGFHIAAGVAILMNIRPRLASILLTIMYASFTPLVHLPLLLSDPSRPFFWTENALNLALAGAAWVVAHSFAFPTSLPLRSKGSIA